MTSNLMKNENRGITPLIVTLLIGIAVVVAAVGGYFGWRALKSGQESGEVAGSADDSLDWDDGFGDLDFSVSGLAPADVPDLTMSGDLDFDLPDLDLSGLSGIDLDLTAPEPDIDAPEPDLGSLTFDFSGLSALADRPAAPAGQVPDEQPSNEAPTDEGPIGEEPPAEEPPQSQVTASNCAQFAAMPSAAYCSQVGDPNGRELCENCKAAGY